MRPRTALLAVCLILLSWSVLLAQKEFREYPGEDRIPLPPDWRVPHEWVSARMMWHSYGSGAASRTFPP